MVEYIDSNIRCREPIDEQYQIVMISVFFMLLVVPSTAIYIPIWTQVRDQKTICDDRWGGMDACINQHGFRQLAPHIHSANRTAVWKTRSTTRDVFLKASSQ